MRSLSIRGVARPEVVLRLVEAAVDLGPVVVLSGELTEWARGRTLAEYGVELMPLRVIPPEGLFWTRK
jgi:hypothetical protein